MFVNLLSFGIIADFPDSVCCFLQRHRHIRCISRPAVLLVHKWFTGQFFASGCSFLKLITALLSSTTFLCHLPVVLRFLLGDMYRYRRICCTEIELQIFRLVTLSLLLPGVGWATIVDIIIYALGNFLPLW
jgi:sorbitol-specific phosphotransferase system component IIC